MHYGQQAIQDTSRDIGQGWRRADVALGAGDTAYDPGSTKTVLAGPGTVTYHIHPSGWITAPGGARRERVEIGRAHV